MQKLPQLKPKVLDDFLECCMTGDEDRIVSEDEIIECIVEDMPDLGDELNEMIRDFVFKLVNKYIMEQVEEYSEDYYEPSARDEAMADIRREFYENHRFATE